MAAWVLRTACTVLDRLDDERRSELREALDLRDEELVRWDRIGRKLVVPFHGDGIVSQFEGYEALEELDWERYREAHGKHMRLDRVLEAEGDDVNRYQASKQADVLMLLYLFPQEQLEELFAHLGYSFDEAAADRNIAYYLQRTVHGSTLSRMVYAWILSRRDRRASWSLWTDALRSDIDDVQGGTTSEGIHVGAMAGIVDLVHRGHAGLAFGDDALTLDPMLPDELSAVRMRIRYRHHWLTLEIGRDAFHVSLDRGPRPSIRIRVRGEAYEMEQGDTRAFSL
jgi:alpha,alpha-trehalase